MSIFDVSTLGAADNQITFNNYSSFPIYRLISRAPQARQLRELDLPIPFESGISDFETLIGKTAYVLQGKMYPQDEATFSSGLSALRKLADVEYEQNDTAANEGYVPYVYSENGIDTRQVFLKVLYVDIRESTAQGLIQPFQLICKVRDPHIYGYPAKVASTQSVNPTTQGGTAVFPFAFPIIFGGSTGAVSNMAYNTGNVSSYPASITVYGPIANPKITNSATGEFIQINTSLATTNDVLSIVYSIDSVSVTLNGNSVLQYVSSDSTYFKLQPGANNLTLSGSSIGSGAYVTVNYYDAYSLS
jgi:hypothetical protein